MKLIRQIIICASLFAFQSFAAAGIVAKDVPMDFKWDAPKDGEISFRLISLDAKTRNFYVKRGDFFLPIVSLPRDFGSLYSCEKADKITLFERSGAVAGKKGFSEYVPAVEISANSSSNVIIAMFGENEARVVDVSTDSMPLASFSVVNFSPHRLRLKIAKKAVVLKPFEVHTVKSQSNRKLCSSRVAFFNLKDISNPKPIEEKSYSFYSTERVIMFMFKQGESSDAPIFAPYNPRQKRGNAAVGASEMIVITNTGPR